MRTFSGLIRDEADVSRAEVTDPLRLALELERRAARLTGIRGVKVDADHSGIRGVRMLVVPEKDANVAMQELRSVAMADFGIDLDSRAVSVLRATDATTRTSRRKLGSLLTERVGGMFKTRVTLEVPGDVLIGEVEAPVGALFERRAIASAVIEGLGDLLDFEVMVESVGIQSWGFCEIAVVMLVRNDDRLFGSAIVRSSEGDAIARATLDALNRFLGAVTGEVA
jgi:hypothetical protein